eukprot:scaffold13390_cov116-Isochrysis_galbana.AAC.4
MAARAWRGVFQSATSHRPSSRGVYGDVNRGVNGGKGDILRVGFVCRDRARAGRLGEGEEGGGLGVSWVWGFRPWWRVGGAVARHGMIPEGVPRVPVLGRNHGSGKLSWRGAAAIGGASNPPDRIGMRAFRHGLWAAEGCG